MVNKSRKRNTRNSRVKSKVVSNRVVARQTSHTQKRKPLLKGISNISKRNNRHISGRSTRPSITNGGRTLVTTGNQLTWGAVDKFGLLPEVDTRDYPNSYTPTWSSGSPYPSNL